jgi:signal transduction histidine kinase
MRCERAWPDALVARMRLLADIFGSALARRRAQDRIDELLGFERLLVDLSSSLVGSPGTDLDARLQEALHAIATFLEVDRISLWDVAAGRPSPTVTHRWIAVEASVAPQEARPVGLPWIVDEILAGRVVNVHAVADLPPAAGAGADALRAAGVRSLLAIPLRDQDTVVGALALARMRDERPWNDDVVPRLGVFGNMLLGALAQRSAELRARQAMADAVQSREHLAHLARVDAVGAMTAAIAHEIKQPLMAIANYTQAGRRRLAGGDPVDRDKLDELLEKAGSQAALASEVLDRLRAMVRRRETQESRIDLPVLLGNALQFIEIEGRLKDVRIESSIPPDLPPTLGDEIQIQQVVMNLAHNAMEAMTAVPARERVLRLEAEASSDDRILIRVADRGPGIPEAETEQVFEPFHTTKESGLGIGLSICRNIVEAHGGSLRHAPRAGGGTVFYFTLPVAKEGA